MFYSLSEHFPENSKKQAIKGHLCLVCSDLLQKMKVLNLGLLTTRKATIIICLNRNMIVIKHRRPLCYDCSSTEDLRICSEYTSICQKCYNRQIAEIKYFKKYKQLDPEIDQISQNIYLGNEDAALSSSALQERGITAICACGSHLEPPFDDHQKYVYKRYEISDAPKQIIVHLFEDNYRWIKKMMSEGRKILIHCSTGVSRSASFVIAYFMRQKGLSLEESLYFVRSKRSQVRPNNCYVSQLKAYQRQLDQLGRETND